MPAADTRPHALLWGLCVIGGCSQRARTTAEVRIGGLHRPVSGCHGHAARLQPA
jgi:hypothetical protein